jgi:hypothetical protein
VTSRALSASAACSPARGALGHRAEVGLVHREHIRVFEDAGLHELQHVTRARLRHEDQRVDEPRDLRLGLADAHRLDEDAVEDRGQHRDRGPRGVGESAESLARGHRAQEHAAVAGPCADAGAIAEQRAARDAARRIDRDDPDRLVALAQPRTSASSSVDLPQPGAPVRPMRASR